MPFPKDSFFGAGAPRDPRGPALDPHREHRAALYLFVAEILAQHTRASRDEAAGWIADALEERDPAVLTSVAARRGDPAMAKACERSLVELGTTFTRTRSGFTREFSAAIDTAAGLRRVQRRSEHPWEDAPDNVRGTFLQGVPAVTFHHWPLTGVR
jgi:hypothetical protein